jgi:hypothetical protein
LWIFIGRLRNGTQDKVGREGEASGEEAGGLEWLKIEIILTFEG